LAKIRDAQHAAALASAGEAHDEAIPASAGEAAPASAGEAIPASAGEAAPDRDVKKPARYVPFEFNCPWALAAKATRDEATTPDADDAHSEGAD
jgi:hypothetical protein